MVYKIPMNTNLGPDIRMVWFTLKTIFLSLESWAELLTQINFGNWLAAYELDKKQSQNCVALIYGWQ